MLREAKQKEANGDSRGHFLTCLVFLYVGRFYFRFKHNKKLKKVRLGGYVEIDWR